MSHPKTKGERQFKRQQETKKAIKNVRNGTCRSAFPDYSANRGNNWENTTITRVMGQADYKDCVNFLGDFAKLPVFVYYRCPQKLRKFVKRQGRRAVRRMPYEEYTLVKGNRYKRVLDPWWWD